MATWIDDEGRLRESADEKHQFLNRIPSECLDPWLSYDSWNAELAIKLITTGYNLDIKGYCDETKGFPEGSNGLDRGRAFLDVYRRGMSIAKSSVDAGLLKDPDTPINWMTWAERKGYDVSHLKQTVPVTQAAPVESDSTTPSPVTVVEAPASASLPVSTRDIAHAFDGIRWSEKRWLKPLGDKPRWLAVCVARPAVQGVSQTGWNPVLIGAALVHKGYAKQNSIRARFQTKPQLKDWLEAWKTYEADSFDTQ